MASLFESGFFTRQPAWHRQGNVLEDAPTTEVAYEASGLNWQVNKQPLFFKNGDPQVDMATDMFGLVRNTDNRVLGYCKEQYEIFQNIDALNWCDPLVSSELWHYETAGALKNGEVCWVLLKQGERELVRSDILKEYLLLLWSHDGSRAVQTMPTTIRVVCNNTLQMALDSATFRNRIRHTISMKPKLEEIRSIYSETREAFNKQDEMFNRMLDFTMSEGQVVEYVDSIMTGAYNRGNIDEMEEGRSKTIAKNVRETLLSAAYNGTGAQELGINGTMYGVFNGIEEAIEHYIGGNRVKDRGMNILLGSGHDAVNVAYTNAVRMMAA